jgi:hypothetical protein
MKLAKDVTISDVAVPKRLRRLGEFLPAECSWRSAEAAREELARLSGTMDEVLQPGSSRHKRA